MAIKVPIGGDHAGFEYKTSLIEFVKEMGHEVKDFGPYSADSCAYPDYVHPLAQEVDAQTIDFVIVICGSANGVNMVANKYQGVRSAITWLPELAELTRLHNDANILALPARFISLETAKACVKAFLETEFEGGRHIGRVNKIAKK